MFTVARRRGSHLDTMWSVGLLASVLSAGVLCPAGTASGQTKKFFVTNTEEFYAAAQVSSPIIRIAPGTRMFLSKYDQFGNLRPDGGRVVLRNATVIGDPFLSKDSQGRPVPPTDGAGNLALATNAVVIDAALLQDDDGDGQIDEDQPNGLDDDGDGHIDEDGTPPFEERFNRAAVTLAGGFVRDVAIVNSFWAAVDLEADHGLVSDSLFAHNTIGVRVRTTGSETFVSADIRGCLSWGHLIVGFAVLPLAGVDGVVTADLHGVRLNVDLTNNRSEGGFVGYMLRGMGSSDSDIHIVSRGNLAVHNRIGFRTNGGTRRCRQRLHGHGQSAALDLPQGLRGGERVRRVPARGGAMRTSILGLGIAKSRATPSRRP